MDYQLDPDTAPDITLATEAIDTYVEELNAELECELVDAIEAGYDYLHVKQDGLQPMTFESGDEFDISVTMECVPSDDPHHPWNSLYTTVTTYDLRYWTPECVAEIQQLDGEALEALRRGE